MNGCNLKQLYESLGPRQCVGRLKEALGKGLLKPEQFSIRELAESFCGHNWVSRLNPKNLDRFSQVDVLEAGEAVDVTAFANITGQLLYSKIHEGWEQDGMIGDQLFETVSTQFDGEKIPGIGRIVDEGDDIRPGEPYPEAGFSEQYWETPSTKKIGEVVSVTKEAIYFDRTSLILKRAAEVGERVRFRKEKKQLACVAGITVTFPGGRTFNGNNHKWKGTTYNTYATAANAIGINSQASTELVDWTDVNEAEQLFNNLLDPDTGNPILIAPDTLIVMPPYLHTARRIQSATEVRVGDGASASTQTISSNPVTIKNVLSSRLLYKLIQDSGVTASNAKKWWFYGAPKKAFWYMENWPFTVVQAPLNSEKDFEQDIVLRWKASERGIPYVADPRCMTKMYDA